MANLEEGQKSKLLKVHSVPSIPEKRKFVVEHNIFDKFLLRENDIVYDPFDMVLGTDRLLVSSVKKHLNRTIYRTVKLFEIVRKNRQRALSIQIIFHTTTKDY